MYEYTWQKQNVFCRATQQLVGIKVLSTLHFILASLIIGMVRVDMQEAVSAFLASSLLLLRLAIDFKQ